MESAIGRLAGDWESTRKLGSDWEPAIGGLGGDCKDHHGSLGGISYDPGLTVGVVDLHGDVGTV